MRERREYALWRRRGGAMTPEELAVLTIAELALRGIGELVDLYRQAHAPAPDQTAVLASSERALAISAELTARARFRR